LVHVSSTRGGTRRSQLRRTNPGNIEAREEHLVNSQLFRRDQIACFLFGDETPFAFIPNREWVLFYFRLPAVRSGQYDLDVVKSTFDGVRVNGTGEWTVKLRSIADVRRLWTLLQLK
jgi:hypothetical protein